MPTLLTPEQEAELSDWSEKAFAEAQAETERDMQLLNELSRKRAQEKHGVSLGPRPPVDSRLNLLDTFSVAAIVFVIGCGVYTALFR